MSNTSPAPAATAERSDSTAEDVHADRRRNPAPMILLVTIVLLGGYYAMLMATGALNASTTVPVENQGRPAAPDYVTLQMKLEDVNLSTRVVRATVLPAPHGTLVGRRPGEMTRSLLIEIASGGPTTSVVTFPAKSIIDPTSVDLAVDRGDTAFPFDRPFVDFNISVQDERTGEAVPFALDLEDSAHPWVLTATRGEASADGNQVVYPVQLDGHRDGLTVTLVLFYVVVILLTTGIAVVTIGSALIRRVLEFSNVIWLSATMLSFPTLRSVMPGAPPLGTALDYIVFFPCVCAIAVMLLWTGSHLVWREGAVLMGRAGRGQEIG
ncbi:MULTISPECIES: DUF4436 family protein [Nocardioides]|uniref:DUF4436 family protein n=1 Tax=Nocardioides vastitatis TaxID=2568655 RepID=A0ABW0ZQ72_9ACTN|nr:DUF4436 family protein [Nocardioides sp.]THI98321.1 DUF4436 domain-containing protein [Nocardioides sp.]